MNEERKWYEDINQVAVRYSLDPFVLLSIIFCLEFTMAHTVLDSHSTTYSLGVGNEACVLLIRRIDHLLECIHHGLIQYYREIDLDDASKMLM